MGELVRQVKLSAHVFFFLEADAKYITFLRIANLAGLNKLDKIYNKAGAPSSHKDDGALKYSDKQYPVVIKESRQFRASRTAGNVRTKVLPFPTSLRSVTLAPRYAAPCFTMERPRPVPPREWLLSTR